MTSPHDFWSTIQKWTGYYKETPEGTVPAPLIEGVIQIESQGNPRAYNSVGDTYGLGQISPVGLEYSGFESIAESLGGRQPRTPEEKAVYDTLRSHGGRLTTDLLYDPDVNISIMTYGINYRSEHSDEKDWLRLIVTGYFGAGPGGDISNGTTQQQYYDALASYISEHFGADTLKQLQSGTYSGTANGSGGTPAPDPGTDGGAGSVTPTPGTDSGGIGNPFTALFGYLTTALSSVFSISIPFFARVGLFLAGAVLLGIGTWAVLQ